MGSRYYTDAEGIPGAIDDIDQRLEQLEKESSVLTGRDLQEIYALIGIFNAGLPAVIAGRIRAKLKRIPEVARWLEEIDKLEMRSSLTKASS